MKRLLLPLIAAIALLTAVSANLFSKDLIIKTPLEEKYIVKEKSFLKSNRNQDDFIRGKINNFDSLKKLNYYKDQKKSLLIKNFVN